MRPGWTAVRCALALATCASLQSPAMAREPQRGDDGAQKKAAPDRKDKSAAPPALVVPSAKKALAGLVEGHPRLLLTDRRLAELKRLHGSDQRLQRIVQDVLTAADRELKRPVLKYQKRGPRLLHVSRAMVSRAYKLGLAWRWTGQRKYLDKALENLLAVCEFKDWNPSHFLDTAEMSHGVGIGYDWLHGGLDEDTRAEIREGLIRLGLRPGVQAYTKGTHGWWRTSAYNWNQVCNAGLTIGALAVAETDGDYAHAIVPNAVKSLPKALATYAPDGAWPEGPGYWGYATRYTVYGLAAMETALGKDFGLSEIPGLSEAGYFPIYATGPTGLYLNYADSGERARRRPLPSLLWLGRRYKHQFFIDAEYAVLANARADPRHLIWYAPPSGRKLQGDLDKRFRGPVEVAVFRSRWHDPQALFAGVKAGFNQVNHGHLDLGNFEVDALGVRWARELGSDNYNLPGYWRMGRGGKRWTYYRLRSLSHNVPILGGRDQDPHARAKMIAYQSKPEAAFAAVDLTNAYQALSRKTLRGVALTAGRRAVVVQDEFDIVKRCEVAWGMTTDAKVEVQEGGRALLTVGDKRLLAKILTPAGASFTVESAAQKPPQKTNEGVRRLMLRLADQEGKVRIAVLLVPAVDGLGVIRAVKVAPLKDW